MRELLALKRAHDPDELFQRSWYRHYRGMFGSSQAAAAALTSLDRAAAS
jgi:hypothetical protein